MLDKFKLLCAMCIEEKNLEEKEYYETHGHKQKSREWCSAAVFVMGIVFAVVAGILILGKVLL